jgi:hypothetical protein
VIGGGLAIGLIVGRLLRSGAEPMSGGNGWSSGTRSQSAWTGNGGGRTGWVAGSAGSSSTAGTGYGTSYGTDDGADDWTSSPTGSTGGSSMRRRGATTAMSASSDPTSGTEG